MSKFKSSKLQRLGMMGDDGVAYRNKGCKDAWSPADPVKGDDGLYVSVGNNMCLLQSTFTNIEAGGSVGVVSQHSGIDIFEPFAGNRVCYAFPFWDENKDRGAFTWCGPADTATFGMMMSNVDSALPN